MTKFEIGDIVEIALTSDQKYPKWAGLTIAVTSPSSYQSYVKGKVIKAANPDQGYPVNSNITWGAPNAFTHVQASFQKAEHKQNTYISPFTGKPT